MPIMGDSYSSFYQAGARHEVHVLTRVSFRTFIKGGGGGKRDNSRVKGRAKTIVCFSIHEE